jgi:hypothetical protein
MLHVLRLEEKIVVFISEEQRFRVLVKQSS